MSEKKASTDFEQKPSLQLFPGVRYLMWSCKLHLEEQYEMPFKHLISFQIFCMIVIVPYYIWLGNYYLLAPYFQQDQELNLAYALAINGFLSFLVSNLFFMVLYLGKWAVFEKYKGAIEGWPWETDPEWKRTLTKMILFNLFNSTLWSFIVSFVASKAFGETLIVSVEELPDFGKFVLQFCWMLLMEDLSFYWGHRILHHPKLYPYFHKVHHESKVTISLSAIYTHPFEFMISNLLPVKFGAILCPWKIHFITLVIFITYRVVETVENHSGYEFPIAIAKWLPLKGTSNYHNYHHLVNVGNFGSQFIIWDSIFGTNEEYYKHVEKELATKEEGSNIKLKKDQATRGNFWN